MRAPCSPTSARLGAATNDAGRSRPRQPTHPRRPACVSTDIWISSCPSALPCPSRRRPPGRRRGVTSQTSPNLSRGQANGLIPFSVQCSSSRRRREPRFSRLAPEMTGGDSSRFVRQVSRLRLSRGSRRLTVPSWRACETAHGRRCPGAALVAGPLPGELAGGAGAPGRNTAFHWV